MASPYFSLLLLPCFLAIFSSVNLISGKCLQDQRSNLLQFRDSVQINQTYSKRVVRWNRSADCCVWNGVACDGLGHVISLQLDNESISPLHESWKALFHLQYLEDLNLAKNHFWNVNIPAELQNVTRLKHLNLSDSGFVGETPVGLSKMIDLVILDLSYNDDASVSLKLFQNLTELRVVYLGGTNISTLGSDVCNAFSHLSNLQVLSLRNCDLWISCPLLHTLSNLTSLTTIRLNSNTLNSTVPHSLANLTNLRILSLRECELHGPFPENIFHIPTLETLDVWSSRLLRGRIPQLVRHGSLTQIIVSHTNFSGSLPDSIGFLRELSILDLSDCNFHGKVPATLANLSKLEQIDMSNNSLTGRFPSYLFALPSLQRLDLSNNPFDATRLEEFPNASSSSSLQYIALSGNNLFGFIPNFFFHLQRLYFLDISFNSFQGNLRLNFQNDYLSLDLSHNNLSIDATHPSLLPQFWTLKLASCDLKKFPDLRNQSVLDELDLSDNSITGEIPNWLWKLPISTLNLSINYLGGFQKPYTFPDYIFMLDLHSNILKGEVPLPRHAIYVDHSNNYFTTFNPTDNNDIPTIDKFLSLSNNNITGGIPDFLCNQTYLDVLDLSINFLRGTIPQCLLAKSNLGVLDLSGNKLSGHIPDTFNDSSCVLHTLDLSRNNLTGEFPKSLANCEDVEVVNVGNNNLEGHFPCTFTKRQNLRIIVLGANRFDGELNCSNWDDHSWPSLQVLDISRNRFSGALPSRLFSNCGKMMMDDESNAPPLHYTSDYNQDYIVSVWLVIKGTELKLAKILNIYKTLDFSGNHFEGSIPKEIGGLSGLYILNMSHNALTGTIPGSIGGLTQLESLDFSVNQLTGRIPSELGNLKFLQYLNLSYNQLTGRIPDGSQLQLFSESSFFGNKGLCGFPLSSCDNGSSSPSSLAAAGHPDKAEIDWEYVSAALGFSVGLGIILLFNFLNPTWWQRFNALILRFLIIRVFGVHVP